MIFARKIDEQGLFIEDVFVNELTELTIETPCPGGLYLPKWDGEKWIESGTKPEPIQQEPTQQERLESLENVVLSLMME